MGEGRRRKHQKSSISEGGIHKVMKTNLGVLRKSRDESQEDLAQYLKICVRTLIRYEKGEKAPPLNVVYKIADHYEVTIEEVFPPECYQEAI